MVALTARLSFSVSLVALGACSAPRGEAGATPALLDLEVPTPPTPVPIAGTLHLVYELHLGNSADIPLTVDRVEVLNGRGGAALVDLRGEDLGHRIGRADASADVELRVIPPGAHGVLYLEVTLDDPAPEILDHRVTYAMADTGSVTTPLTRSSEISVDSRPLVALGPPVRGGPWAAVYEPSWERGHRRVIYTVEGRMRIPGRYAVDWIKLDDAGRMAHHNQDSVQNWFGYAADVLAVANAVVVAARDDVPESPTISGHPHLPLADATGNYVALDLGDGSYAFYEHLAPGSIRVVSGERVTLGQVLGSLGFTGHSTGPHLHFHVADGSSALGAEGLPFVLERFTVLGIYNDVADLGKAPWIPLDAATDSRHVAEFPAANVVVEFGAAKRGASSLGSQRPPRPRLAGEPR